MQMQRHGTVHCPICGSRPWYGLKEEPSGWKVYYECGECGFERMVGTVPIADVDSRDEAWGRAEQMARRL